MTDETDDKKITGRAKGGIARKEALSPQERRRIAVKAAEARWGVKPLTATHRGNFKAEFGFDVDCFVLDDEQRTAVISKRGMGSALGLSESGSAFPDFIKGAQMALFVGGELARKLANPVIFQWKGVGANKVVHGHDVTILIDVCNAIIAADDEGKLPRTAQQRIVKQAHVIRNASAKHGITQLVYALAGYDQTRAERIAAFKVFVAEEAREYEKEFPDGLYEEWYRLYGLPKPEKNKPWKFRTLTIEHVYKPLAQSNGKILELTRALKAKSEARWKKLHQFLSEIGVKALRSHLGVLHGIAMFADNSAVYEERVEQAFGKPLQIQIDMGF